MSDNFKFLARIVPIILSILVFGWLVTTVVKTEILTNWYQKDIDLAKVCQNYTNLEVKMVKILEYEPYKKSAEGYCLFQNTQENLKVYLNKSNNSWKIIYSQKLNKPGNLYWPIYY